VKKKIIAVVAALGAFGALTASAATLGGLTSTTLGADQTVVASCDTDGIGLAYANTYDAATNTYRTTSVTMTGVNATCATKAFRLTLSDATASLSETTGTVTLASGSQTVALASSVDARSITRAALVITG
jgi:N-acetyl-beta-hexosaminidase